MASHISSEQSLTALPGIGRKPTDPTEALEFVVHSFEAGSTLQLSQATRECRICLESEEGLADRLVAPCRCTGSVRFVHEGCFRGWLLAQYRRKTKPEQQLAREEGIECELCRQNFFIGLKEGSLCCEEGHFAEQCIAHKCIFAIMLTTLVLASSSLAYLVVYSALEGIDFGGSLFWSICIVLAFFCLAVAIALVLYNLASTFCLTRSLEIDQIATVRPGRVSRSRRVEPE